MRARCFGLPAHWLAAGLCLGLASANGARASSSAVAALAVLLAGAGAVASGARLSLLVAALLLAGWWWGSVRLDALDRSVLLGQVGRAERSRVVVTGPPRRGRFELRVPARVTRFGRLAAGEPVLLELPLGRAPPQGAILDVLGVVELPRGPSHGFDERTWLRRHGIHVVLHGDRSRVVGRRGGLGGFADRLRARLARTATPGLRGERRAVLAGVVLGDDQGLSDDLRQRFRASGSTTFWRSRGRTSRSSRVVRSSWPGWSERRAGWGSSERSPRSARTSSRSEPSRRSCGPGSPARWARSPG